MTKISLKRHNILDGEKLFRLYFTDMGSARSIGKVIKYLGNDAINPDTGRVVTPMAIWFSIYRWAFENLDESYQIYNKAMMDEGKFHTQAEWEEFVNGKAQVISKKSTRKLERWQKRVNQKQLMTNA